MIIHYTKALRTKLKIPDFPAYDTMIGPHLRWYAHFFRANRVQYVLTTNSKATDRRVLGSMNNMVQLCKWKVEDREPTPSNMTKRLNKISFQAIEF